MLPQDKIDGKIIVRWTHHWEIQYHQGTFWNWSFTRWRYWLNNNGNIRVHQSFLRPHNYFTLKDYRTDRISIRFMHLVLNNYRCALIVRKFTIHNIEFSCISFVYKQHNLHWTQVLDCIPSFSVLSFGKKRGSSLENLCYDPKIMSLATQTPRELDFWNQLLDEYNERVASVHGTNGNKKIPSFTIWVAYLPLNGWFDKEWWSNTITKDFSWCATFHISFQMVTMTV